MWIEASPGLAHNASIQRLNGSSVVRVQLSKCSDLCGRSRQRGLEHNPEDWLSTGRRSLRSCIGVVTEAARKQARRVDEDSAGSLLTFNPRHVSPDLLNRLVPWAPVDQDSDPHNAAIASAKHQVSFHLVWFPLNVFLARVMKMKLRELISFRPDDEKVATSRRDGVIHANGMAIVDDVFQRSCSEFKADCRKICFPRVANIDGRLRVAGIALCVQRIESTPAVSLFIGPWCPPWRLIVLWALSSQERRLDHRGSQEQYCGPVVSQLRLPIRFRCVTRKRGLRSRRTFSSKEGGDDSFSVEVSMPDAGYACDTDRDFATIWPGRGVADSQSAQNPGDFFFPAIPIAFP